MPWKVIKLGKSYAVQNELTKKISGRFEKKAEAEKQVAALYSNMKEMPGYKGTHVGKTAEEVQAANTAALQKKKKKEPEAVDDPLN